MIIDTKELRRLAQEATPGPWRIGAMESGRVAIDGVNGSEVTGFIDPEDGHLILAVANPQSSTIVHALLDRLEAAEKEREIDEQRIADLMAEMNRVGHENDKLRAKIARMEQQEPVAWRTFDGEGGYDYRSYEDNENYKLGWDARNPNHIGWVEPLYALPGAKGEEK